MFLKPQFRKAGRSGRPGPSPAGRPASGPARLGLAALGLLGLMLAMPSPLRAQTDFDTDSIFQGPAGPVSRPPSSAAPVPGAPALPPSASDPFTLPPAGSIPLGSSAPPLTSPATSAPEFHDDPFGTPAPETRQVRQVGETVEQPAPETAAPATAAPDQSAADPASAYVPPEARQTLDEAQRARLRALFPDMLPPEDQTISALTPSTAPADPAASPAPDQPEPDGAAIGRAGALLTKEYYGQAQILPPLELPPVQEETSVPASASSAPAPIPKAKPDTAKPQPAAPPAKPQPAANPVKLLPTPNTATPQPAAKPVSPQPAAKPKTAPPTAKAKDSPARNPAPARPRGSLALVNETGDPQVGAVYHSALSRLGYTVLAGPAGGFRGGPAGQTVIYYRPGAQTRALAVSRDLPGRKTLAEAPAGANTDVVVVLR